MLTWDEVVVQFENLVKFAAKNVYLSRASVDNAVGVDDLYQIGMLKLYDCWCRYNEVSMEEFKKVFSTALFRAVRRGAKPNMSIDIEQATEVENYEVNFLDDMYTSEQLEQLKGEINSPIALAILQELLDPSPRTVWESWADKARKEFQKNKGSNVNVPKSNDVKMKHIRAALGITQKQFDLGILEVRQKATLVFEI